MNIDNKFISALSQPFIAHSENSQLWLLVDPDRVSDDELRKLAESAQKYNVDALLVGSSILVQKSLKSAISILKSNCALPVLIFPGGREQIAQNADAILFLTFLSSRNPRWLIDEQVLASTAISTMKIPVIPTGYLLIESGSLTSVGFFSTSPPLPSSKPDIAVAHALAAQNMGMHTVFLEAGSGAKYPVPVEIIEQVSNAIDIPVIVGGGIRSPKEAEERAKFADAIVIGNFFENIEKLPMLKDFADAIHKRSA